MKTLLLVIAGMDSETGQKLKTKQKNARFRLRDCPPPQVEIRGT